ncbi:MAG: molecular chaperone TorD family protein [Polyangiales bacterium]
MSDPARLSSEELVALRRDLASLLAGLLVAPPTDAALAALRDPDAARALEAAVGPEASAALATLDRERPAAALREEFFALLAVPGPRYRPPFESLHCDDGAGGEDAPHGLAGEAAVRVAERFRRAGFAVAVPELPDHAGCELAFLAALLDAEREALARGDTSAARRAAREAAEFARAHPLRWLDVWARSLADDPAAVLYPAVGALAAALARAVARAVPALPVVR